MPIYEFYCVRCNTIYNFLSRKIQPDKRPNCPRCKTAKLDKRVSLFAATGRAKEGKAGGDADAADLPIDEAKMERAMETLASQAENISEDDPRQAADMMRRFSSMTGMKLGSGMEEALNRLESGEDPEQIEAELGDRLEKEDPFLMPDSEPKDKVRKAARPAPLRDTTLYEM